MSFSIVTDTAANLPTSILEANCIKVLPLSYSNRAGQVFSYPVFESFRCREYYQLLRSGEKITTSHVNPQNYVDCMEPLLREGQDVLFVGISAGISASFSSAGIARAQLLEDYPQRDIRLVDSMGASLGEGLVVLRAIRCREEGMSLDETARFLEDYRRRVYQVFTVDDLMYLRRGGRLSNMTAIAGTILGIKPLLKGNEKGKIVSFGKARGRKGILSLIAKKYQELVMAPETQLVCISHADCPEDAAYLADLIRSIAPPRDILIVEHEPVTGSYLGPGALALYFEGDSTVRTR